MEPLEPAAQHRPVMLVQESPSDIHDTARIDAEKVPVVGGVMDGTKRDPVDDRGYAVWIPGIDDVCSLEKRCLAELAHRTPG